MRRSRAVHLGGKRDSEPFAAGMGAVERLSDGNGRFRAAVAAAADPDAARAELAKGDPYAVILGCSDSRVAPEIIFDESLGRLFVVRVAAHVAGPAEIGSVEYAVARWNCPLVVVLGHTQCGGVGAVLDGVPSAEEARPSAGGSMSLASLLSSIKSNLGWAGSTAADPWLSAVERNVSQTREKLLTWSPPLRQRVTSGELTVAGAIYHVETGEVEFLK
jgi:carbonic anhydrase